MGLTEPGEQRDEVVQFIEARRGTYKKLIIRDGRLMGGILLGDSRKPAFLLNPLGGNPPCPQERTPDSRRGERGGARRACMRLLPTDGPRDRRMGLRW